MADKNNLKILFVASEVAPFAKTGGLADVAGSLPMELAHKGNDIRIVMPRYKRIDAPMSYVTDFPIIIDQKKETCIVRETQLSYNNGVNKSDVPVYFIDNYHYFDRDYLYCYADEAERFAFFCRSIIEMLPKIDFCPDIIHCNDWQSGPICMLLKEQYKDNAFYNNISTIFTIHNLHYQGNYGKDTLKLFGLGEEYFVPQKTEFYGEFSFLKCGLIYADILNAVSQTYAKEIQTLEQGERMEGILKQRKEDLYGIINGISYDDFNPKTDPRICKNYSLKTIHHKKDNKSALQRELGLPVKDVPVIGFISRMVAQKGLDIIDEIFDEIMKRNINLVMLGTGDSYYENFLKSMKEKYPNKLGLYVGFNANLAQRIYAGADMFLLPSKFEPCGLGQIISLRYGTIPIVREIGGLADTIKDFSIDTKEGNGFVFSEYSSEGMLKAIDKALDIYNSHPEEWNSLIQTAFNCDFSWEKSAEKYQELYLLAMKKH